MIWVVRYMNVVLITLVLLWTIGLVLGAPDDYWCMFPEHNVVRPLPCDWAGGFPV